MSQKVYTNTIGLHPTQNRSASFSSKDGLLDGCTGFAFSVVAKNAINLDMDVYLEDSACSNGNFAIVPGSLLTYTNDDTVVFNYSGAYFKFVRASFTFRSGSADILIELTTKG